MDDELKQVLFRTVPFLLLIIGILIGSRRGKFRMADLYMRPPTSYLRLMLWWSMFLLFVLITEFTLYQLGLLKVGQWSNTLIPSIIKITGMLILAPIAEELLFRGLILHVLRKWSVQKHLAIALQALLFTAIHSGITNYDTIGIIGKLQLFTDASLFAYAMYSTRSILTPILMHATGNLVAVLELFWL